MLKDWQQIVYAEAVMVNPRVHLEKGKPYPFLDMASVDSSTRCALAKEWRPFTGGGARFAVGDTLLARITPCLENGKIARYCGQFAHEAHGSTEFIVIRGRENITDSAYAYYLTKWEGVSGYAISQMTGTSGRQRVPTESLSNLLVPVPPLPEQRRIAHILGTLDDRIENNRKTAKTLEAMAQAIFKSWFVDFDPVRAKMAGESQESICKRLKLTPEILDLFPDRLVDSELGEIPEGWEVGTLEKLLVLQRGFDLPTKDRVKGDFPVIAAGGINGSHHEPMVRGPGVITGRSGVLGNAFFELGDFWPLNTTLWVKEFRAAKPCYAFQLLRCIDFAVFNAGSAVPTLNRNHIHGLQQVIPTADCVEQFETITFPMRQHIATIQNESRTLAQLRDTLLPKLISGELRVPAAQDLVEDALL